MKKLTFTVVAISLLATSLFALEFKIDKTEVTQYEYSRLMSHPVYGYAGYIAPPWGSGQFGEGDNIPVYYVNWYDAVLYCNARSKEMKKDTVYRYTAIEGTPGNNCKLIGLEDFDINIDGVRLPTEAEWEYACRAGTTTEYYWGSSDIGDYAWNMANGGSKGQPVATKLPNGFGLYDMSGNLYEWCNDWYGNYSSDSATNPTGAATGKDRIVRGGGWWTDNNKLRSASRATKKYPSYSSVNSSFRAVCR